MTDTNLFERIHTGVDGSGDADDFMVTHFAIDTVLAIKAENNVPEDYKLRIGTRGGGCSGMNYTIGFDPEVNEFDSVYSVKELDLVIDNKSIFYLMGVTLDYVDGPDGSGFVFNNPFHEKTCGCSH